jgi:hypothetical protein
MTSARQRVATDEKNRPGTTCSYTASHQWKKPDTASCSSSHPVVSNYVANPFQPKTSQSTVMNRHQGMEKQQAAVLRTVEPLNSLSHYMERTSIANTPEHFRNSSSNGEILFYNARKSPKFDMEHNHANFEDYHHIPNYFIDHADKYTNENYQKRPNSDSKAHPEMHAKSALLERTNFAVSHHFEFKQ